MNTLSTYFRYNLKELFQFYDKQTDPSIVDQLIESGWEAIRVLNSLNDADHKKLAELSKLMSYPK